MIKSLDWGALIQEPELDNNCGVQPTTKDLFFVLLNFFVTIFNNFFHIMHPMTFFYKCSVTFCTFIIFITFYVFYHHHFIGA